MVILKAEVCGVLHYIDYIALKRCLQYVDVPSSLAKTFSSQYNFQLCRLLLLT